ncbi:preprotein translocase subunit SecE [Candidatus Shapirobacteria bacterium CG03_land_8_20_14_0_80_39_12]|uniref:Protein translocase subunit SecE n=1 Tax=Candidatus Shapirobacteria bacterium CG03_land_8_20_14_0_80_39_12 TaxID=1974879 RepID=A0A2M7BB69_9BACT|nr:MAG: preprotein translocase subunit SecE [Candidatus Shapirobacteria bacterium CG03_land_8_20_14_0_80_39_12]
MLFMPQLNPVKFFGEVKAELLKVTWPSKNEVIRLTAIVIIISLIVGAFLGGLDFIFTKSIEFILKK